MKEILVSIITPSYNRADFIELCMQSVMNQTYKNIEHIVIDGGSSDNTVNILERSEKSYNLRWVSEKDEGMYHAINKGIEMAKGDVIAYLNSDDAYFPWSVEVAIGEIKKGYSIIFGDLCILKRDFGRDVCFFQFYLPFWLFYYLHLATIAQPTVFFRRELINRVGLFDTNFKLLADCEYWIRCANKGFVPHKINEILALQIDHEGTLRETQRKQLLEEFAKIRKFVPRNETTKYPALRKLCSVIIPRVYKIRFYFAYFTGIGNSWSNIRRHFATIKYKLNKKGVIKSLLPGFMTDKDASYSVIEAQIIFKTVKSDTID